MPLCRFWDKVGTNPKEKALPVLYDGELNSKTFRQLITDIGAFRAVEKEVVN